LTRSSKHKPFSFSDEFGEQIIHVEELPEREAQYTNLSRRVHPAVRRALHAQDIELLYSHQAQGINHVRDGRNLIVVTGTASGKTLCYMVPILDQIAGDPGTRALMLYPTKALAQDQLRGLQRLQEDSGLQFISGTYDGDTPTDHRRSIREQASCILTNPDMLHRAVLPNHDRWANFFSRLKIIVIDEVHIYRGIFGSHVSNVMRRLHRICRHHGSNPVFVCCSATIANPKELAERIAHVDFELVNEDGSPSGPKQFVLWNPPFIDEDKTQRRSANSDATRLMSSLIADRIQTITFSRTRKSSELIFRYVQDRLEKDAPRLVKKVQAYRGGYLPEERREIERRLAEGDLLGVSTTNALELGIDIGSLDACIIVGYPGTVASTWQQAGRAGRTQDESLVFLIGQNNPIDQYMMHHPEYIFGRPPEHAVVDPDNPHISLGHLRCAMRELPLSPHELDLFGIHTAAMVELLAEGQQAKMLGDKWRLIGDDYPAGSVELRTATDVVYTIQDSTDGSKVIGTIDELSAYSQVHTNAIYLHSGETYFVDELDTDRKIAHVTRQDVDYFTQAVDDDELVIDREDQKDQWRKAKIHTGDVRVITNWLMFKKVKFQTRESIGFEGVDLPTYTLETTALWLIPPKSAVDKCVQYQKVPAEGMEGIANLIRDVMPMYVLCDPTDVGSLVDSSNLDIPALFVYDKYDGGIGFAEKAFTLVEELMQAMLKIVQECECKSGCPSCVGSTITAGITTEGEAAARERLPDKEAALIILHDLLELEPYVPKNVGPVREAAIEMPKEPPPEIITEPLPPDLERKIRKRVQKFGKKS